MDSTILIAIASICSAAATVAITSFATAIGESGIAKQAIQSIAQQPDEGGQISKTLFVSLALVESSAIYGLLIAMILIFSNPFWNFLIQQTK